MDLGYLWGATLKMLNQQRATSQAAGRSKATGLVKYFTQYVRRAMNDDGKVRAEIYS